MLVRSCSASELTPLRSSSSTVSNRSGPGVARPSSISSSESSARHGGLSSSRERSALAKACWNVRPMAIASPTDFICVVSVGSVPGNFSKANRGHFTTT